MRRRGLISATRGTSENNRSALRYLLIGRRFRQSAAAWLGSHMDSLGGARKERKHITYDDFSPTGASRPKSSLSEEGIMRSEVFSAMGHLRGAMIGAVMLGSLSLTSAHAQGSSMACKLLQPSEIESAIGGKATGFSGSTLGERMSRS